MKRLLFIPMIFSLSLVMTNVVVAAEEETIHSEIFYNILVDRFSNMDGSQTKQVDLEDPYAYHGGDLKGITKKLDFLSGLGYTSIVLSPIMANAPDGYHGYWIEDYYKVDEQFGTMKDLKKLVKEAHKLDMKVILEFVPNYVSQTHPILKDDSKKDWIKDENHVKSSQWLDQVAVLNQSNPEVQAFLTDVADYWIEKANIDGYEFHAAEQTNKTFLKELTAHINKKYPDFYMIADILNPEDYTGSLKKNTHIQLVENNTLYEPMTSVFSKAGKKVSTIYESWVENGKKKGLNYVDNKYTERFTRKATDNGRSALTTWKLMLTYLYTAPGVPMIYQGSEIPMGGGEFPANQRLVQFNSGQQDLKDYIVQMAALRSKFPALQKGDYELLGSRGAMSVFKRSYEGESIYIAINNDVETRSVSIDGIDTDKMLKGLIHDNLVRDNEQGEFRIGLERETAEIYVVQEDKGLNWVFISMVLGIFIVFIAMIIYLSRKQRKRETEG